MNKLYNDARDAVFEELYEIALKDPNVSMFLYSVSQIL